MSDKRRFIVTIDVGQYKSDWEVRAMLHMIRDYFYKSGILKDSEDVILWPIKGEHRLYYLDGHHGDITDEKILEEMADRLTPVLSKSLDVKNDKKDQDKA